MNRFYLRCNDCCHIFVVETETTSPYPGRQCECGGCGGNVVLMGKVSAPNGTRLVEERLRTPCDDRCTHARGPICDCPCLGRNHGTGRVVRVVVDVGAVPRVIPHNAEECRATAAEWKAAHHAAMEQSRAIIPVRGNRYLPPVEWEQYLAGHRLLTGIQAVTKLKTHAGRMRKLTALTAAATTYQGRTVRTMDGHIIPEAR